MRNKQSIVIQIIIWIAIWSVFAFSASEKIRDGNFFINLSIRVIGYIILYNIVYYFLIPIYLSEKKKKFSIITVLIFIGYVLTSIIIDYYLRSLDPEMRHRHIPLMFIIIPPMAMGIAVIGSALSIGGFSEYEKKKISEEDAINKRLEAEIQLLKSQINPHFMLNSLNNIYAISISDYEKTPDAILKLSQMVSYILYECPKKRVSLSQDLDFIKTYISLQQIRLPDNINVITSIQDHIESSLSIEPMVLISFIENAFKHGITTKEKSDIIVNITVEGKSLKLLVQNGNWSKKELYKGNNSGIGISNTTQRLEHSYRNKYNLDISDKDNIHTVYLTLNLDS